MRTILFTGAALAAAIFLLGCEDSALLKFLKIDNQVPQVNTHRTVLLTDTWIGDISAAIDSSGLGNIYVTWKNATKHIKFMRSTDKGATWGQAVDADAFPASSGRTRIVAPTSTGVVIVNKSGTDLRCATSGDSGANWMPAIINGGGLLDSNDSKENFSLVTASPGTILIYNHNFGATAILKAFALSSLVTPAGWNDFPSATPFNNLDSSTSDFQLGIGSSLAAGSSNKLYVGYLNKRSPGGSSFAAVYNGTAWGRSNIQVNGTNAPNGDTAVEVGNGKVYLAYAYEPSHAIWIAQASDILASPPVSEIYTGLGAISSIRMTVPGMVIVAFFETDASAATGSIKLVYSKDQGTTWSSSFTVDTGLDVQEFGFVRQGVAGVAGDEAVEFFYKAKSSDGVSEDLVYSWINTNDLP
jgi:hypothetical protein